jgi:hypothetical protein
MSNYNVYSDKISNLKILDTIEGDFITVQYTHDKIEKRYNEITECYYNYHIKQFQIIKPNDRSFIFFNGLKETINAIKFHDLKCYRKSV